MGIRFNNPQRLDRPMSRQAFRPGQWNGVRVGGGNTYIQNNFYGMQTSYRGWNNNAWAAYDYSVPQSCNDGISTIGKIGLGAAILGKLMDVFGLGNKDKTPEEVPAEQGARQPEDPNTPLTTQETRTPQSQEPPATVAPPPTDPKERPEQEETPTGFDWNSDFTIVAQDEGNPTQPIQGKVKVDGEVKQGETPQSFTITDNGGTYKFVATGDKRSDGKPIYECVEGPGGTKYTKGNQYALTSDGGTPQLIQYKDMAGWGTGVGKVKK